MAEIPQVLNLKSLAKTAADVLETIPGTDFSISLMRDPSDTTLEDDVWLLVLEGELIIDLPYGDFRILRTGDSVHLLKDVPVSYQPQKDTIVLWHSSG